MCSSDLMPVTAVALVDAVTTTDAAGAVDFESGSASTNRSSLAVVVVAVEGGGASTSATGLKLSV